MRQPPFRRPLVWIATLPFVLVVGWWFFWPGDTLNTRKLVRVDLIPTASEPYAIDISDGNELYVSSRANTVWVFDLGNLQAAPRSFSTQTNLIRGLRVRPGGNRHVYLADSQLHIVVVHERLGAHVSTFSVNIDVNTQAIPHGFMFLPSDDWVLSDQGNLQLVHMSAQDSFDQVITSSGLLSRPRQLAYDPANQWIYAVDRDNGRVKAIQPDGTLVRTFGEPTATGGTFDQHHCV